MKDNKAAIIGTVALIVIAGGVIIAMSSGSSDKSKTSTKSTTSSASSTSTNQTSASTSDATAATEVSIENYMFSPASIKVKVGDTVTWTNKDSVHHNVTADTASADAPNGPLIGKGETYKFTFKKAGTYTFHCGPHPYMHGTVVVTD